MKKILLLTFFFNALALHAQDVDFTSRLADEWEFLGPAVQHEGYDIWGSSPIKSEDGKIHIFVARWPDTINVVPGWKTHSEIAHYVGNGPEGPFEFSDVAITGTHANTWDKFGAHNPTIHKVGDQYVLLYIANDGLEHMPWNQRIGMATSKSLYGPWEKVGRDGMILQPPANPKYWNYNPGNGVNNPAFLQHPGGGFFLYFKSQNKENRVSTMGLAFAEQLKGPYIQLPFPITRNESIIEDGYAFYSEGKFHIITTDNHGMIERGGGLIWSSNDGINFEAPKKAFHLIKDYLPEGELPKNLSFHYGGTVGKFERPQVLMENGRPAYLYAPSGTNIYGGNGTISYVLKRKSTDK
ncbi:glycoside hydrolase family protein [Fulvivirgaceae bacterium BMA10]|uniref:Glycoside hydrolase family protein n=1 Tax=Splendidivirga corallicola TaxID=3051826 RepID=A0ABT8KS22_9BACT|nr:glycoside hydrolase family protein [Fulvivirgaceae bacterium BMA10]